ncbi:MAG: BatA domain-containing protein [Microthrixaceae bacterium]|nr:BatA domain-containing protein [Microthrixaceae bacterium]
MTEHFLAPSRLWFLLAVLALGAVYVAFQFRRNKFAIRISSAAMLDKVAPHRAGWRRHVVAALYLLGLACLVVAYASRLPPNGCPANGRRSCWRSTHPCR